MTLKFNPPFDQLEVRAQFIRETLEKIYPHLEIPLHHGSPFTLLVAVILSTQCTDARVNQVTPKLFAQAETPETMSQLPLDVLENLIRPCGFFRNKAKNIQACARMLIEKFHSKVPDNFQDLEQLPGVGHKTASVMMAHCFHQPAFPVDTHIRRLANRWGLVNSPNVVKVEQTLKKIYPPQHWDTLHIRMIQFGRDYCPSRGHKIEMCPICRVLFKGHNDRKIRPEF